MTSLPHGRHVGPCGGLCEPGTTEYFFALTRGKDKLGFQICHHTLTKASSGHQPLPIARPWPSVYQIETSAEDGAPAMVLSVALALVLLCASNVGGKLARHDSYILVVARCFQRGAGMLLTLSCWTGQGVAPSPGALDLAELTASQVVALLCARDITAVEYVQALNDRYEAGGYECLNAWITYNFTQVPDLANQPQESLTHKEFVL